MEKSSDLKIPGKLKTFIEKTFLEMLKFENEERELKENKRPSLKKIGIDKQRGSTENIIDN